MEEFMLAVLLLIVPVAVVSALILLIYASTGIDVLSFSFFIVIPVGSLLATHFMFKPFGKHLEKVQFHAKKLKHVTFILALLIFVGIQFAQYKITYIDNGDMNYQMRGEHISHYANPDTGEAFTFVSFFKYQTNHASISFSRKLRTIFHLDGWKFLNWIKVAISFLGFVLGAVVTSYGSSVNKQYCNHCKRYMDSAVLSVTDDFNSEKMYELKKEIEASNSIIDHIKAHPVSTDPISMGYHKLILHYCNNCKDGLVEIEEYKRRDLDKFSKYGVSTFVKVDKGFVNDHLFFLLNETNA